MRALPSVLLALLTMTSALVACSSTDDDASSDPAAAAQAHNPTACPADYPSGGSCSPDGITCAYSVAGKLKRVQCLIEGPDSGTSSSSRWWPLY